jgi:predicted Zn-dependent protease
MKQDKRYNQIVFLLAMTAGLSCSLFMSGCASVARVGAQVGQATGVMTPQQADSLVKSAEAVEKTFKDITPEQEYYIGRSVGATIVSTYKIYGNDEATRYLNVLGQGVARYSDMPETFKGYHFLILDTDEINAFAAPGGFIFISRGMIRLCRSEDDLAAIVAHEVGHVQLRHAVGAIKSSRLTSALTVLAVEGTKSFGGEQLAQLTEAFEGSINDITKTMMNSGYARGQEREADKVAIVILKRTGYKQASLPNVLTRMGKVLETDHRGFGATHPPADVRVKELLPLIDDTKTPVPTSVRQKRFDRFISNI